MNSPTLYREPFVRESKGGIDGVYVGIYDRPCFKVTGLRYAPFVSEQLAAVLKLCSAVQIIHGDGVIFCVASGTKVAEIRISTTYDGVILSGEYLLEGNKRKFMLKLSAPQYLALAMEYDFLPKKVFVTEPIKVCTAEEKILIPIFNHGDRFYAIHKNGDIKVMDKVKAEIELIPVGSGILPTPPRSLKEGVEILENVYSYFIEWHQHDPYKAMLLHGGWGYMATYWRYETRRILFFRGPRGSGKSTLLIHLHEMSNEVSKLVSSASGAAARDILSRFHGLFDDVDENLTIDPTYDINWNAVDLAYYYKKAARIPRVTPEGLRLKEFILRGAVIKAGVEAGLKLMHRGISRRHLEIPITRNLGYFRYIIESEIFNMGLSIIGLAEEVNGYRHNMIPENPYAAVNVILKRYTVKDVEPVTIKPEDNTIGDPILEVLIGIIRKLLKVADSTNLDRFKYIKSDKNGVFQECYIAIDARAIPRITYPGSDKAYYTVTKAVGTDKPLTISKGFEKRYFEPEEVSDAIKGYLYDIPEILFGYDKNGHPKIFVRIDCEKSDLEIRNTLKAVAKEIEAVVRNLLNGNADFLNTIKL